MRKLFLGALLICSSITINAQVKIGLQLSPNFSSNRIELKSDDFDISNDGAKLKFKFGPIFDFSFSENYAFSTGLIYAPKTLNLKATNTAAGLSLSESYNMQYLQIPVALKLFTNEIALDTRLYFSLGLLTEINIHEEADDNANFIVEDFQFFDASLHLGAGVEHNLGLNTIIFGGLSYNRGLVNIVTDQSSLVDDDLKIRSTLFNLDLGIKF